tara:strand:+ start:242 stop:820 length:579 start_codon:yes stop_codon:yes gene_type:complete
MKQSKINEILKRLGETDLSSAYDGQPPEALFFRFIEDKGCYIKVLTSFHYREKRRIENIPYRVSAQFYGPTRKDPVFIMHPQVVSMKQSVDDIIDETMTLVEQACSLIDSCEDVQAFLQKKSEEEAAIFEQEKVGDQRETGQLVKHRDYPESFGVIAEIEGKNMKIRWIRGLGEHMPIERHARKSTSILPFP